MHFSPSKDQQYLAPEVNWTGLLTEDLVLVAGDRLWF
jgi:hypothetical protein